MNVGVGYYNDKDANTAGRKATEIAMEKSNLSCPDFVLAFCSGQLDHDKFFEGIQTIVGPESPIIGGSAIGIITNDDLSYKDYPAGVAAVELDGIQHKIVSVNDLHKDERLAGKKLARNFTSQPGENALIIFYDSIKSPATEDNPPLLNASSLLIEGIDEGIKFNVPLFGAGLLGDYGFTNFTRQFCGSYVDSQSVIGVLLTGDFKPYFRIMHGCSPLDGVYYTVTKIEGSIIYELDGKPIVQMIDEIYGNQEWRNKHPLNLLTIGVNHGRKFDKPKESNYVNRLIIGALPDGKGVSLFEPDLKCKTEIQFMLRDSARMIESARKNSLELMKQIVTEGKRPVLGIYIDCAGRTADYSNTLYEEAAEVQKILTHYKTPLLGFYSGVEIAPLLQKSRGLDWTGVLLVLAE